jgi:hypothetical protein
MKKYLIKVAFSCLERVLVIEGDEVYAEKVREMYQIYSIKTRKRIGSVSSQLFETYI